MDGRVGKPYDDANADDDGQSAEEDINDLPGSEGFPLIEGDTLFEDS